MPVECWKRWCKAVAVGARRGAADLREPLLRAHRRLPRGGVRRQGRAVQVGPVEPNLTAPGTKR